jgi:transposase
LISLWLYAYSQGISSAREIARQCAFEPGFAWLCGLSTNCPRVIVRPVAVRLVTRTEALSADRLEQHGGLA